VLDERNDPFAASRAAGKLLAYNYSITGNWPMAITAYNHGLGGVRRAMREYGDTAYVDILRGYNGRTFGFASRNFYVAFLAAMHVDLNAEQYFPGLVVDEPVDYASVTLESYLSLQDLAGAIGVSEARLVEFNQAIQATIETGNKHLPRGFTVRVPRAVLDAEIDQLVAAIPAERWQNEQLPDMFHTVARGDTLSQIAETYKTRVSTLVALNGLRNSHSIRAGQQLRLPAAGPAPAVVAAAAVDDTEIASVVEPEPEPEPEVAMAAPLVATQDLVAATPDTVQTTLLSDPSDYSVAADGTIEIHPLETLGHYGDWLEIKTQRLRDLNGLAFRTPVEVGDRIRLDLNTVDAATFEARREEFHRRQQDAFFREHVITGIEEHRVAAGESVWILSLRKYDVPIWLFRQYNPELDLHNVRAGTRVQFPLLSTP
jgi:membrane-bound lytic murein transglycosylase D